MNAQQQAALAQAQAAKAQQAAKMAPAASQPTPEQQKQMEAYYKQQQLMQQQIESGIRQALTVYNLDIQRLNLCAQALESAWKILNVEGNEEEVNKVVNTTRVVHELVDGIVMHMADQVSAQKEQEAKAAEVQKLALEEAERLASEGEMNAIPIEQPQNAPVVNSPATGEAPAPNA